MDKDTLMNAPADPTEEPAMPAIPQLPEIPETDTERCVVDPTAKKAKVSKNIRPLERLIELPPSKMTDAEKSFLISALKKELADSEEKLRTFENKNAMLAHNCESAYEMARQATGSFESLKQKKQVQDSYIKQAANVFYQSMLLAMKE